MEFYKKPTDVADSFLSDMMYIEDEPIYHYTTSSGLKGILDNKNQGDSEEKFFWATNILHQNDHLEFIHGIQFVRDFFQNKYHLDKLEEIHSNTTNENTCKPCKLKLLDGYRRDFDNLIDKDEAYFIEIIILTVDRMLKNELNNCSTLNFYTISFCQDIKINDIEISGGDRLSQWKGYGSNGSGFSIKLMPSYFELTGSSGFTKVVYNDVEKEEIVENITSRFFSLFKEFVRLDDLKLNSELINRKLTAEFITPFLRTLLLNALRFKHSGFVEENEIRYFHILTDEQLKFRDTGQELVDYIEVKVKNSIKHKWKITFGPKKSLNTERYYKKLVDLIGKSLNVHIDAAYSSLPYK